MATYPIKMLRDEDRQPFVPFTNAAAIVDSNNVTLQELMDNGKYKIQNNVTTSQAGKGVLDAYQGKVLNDKFNNYVPLSQKGVANGVATLDGDAKVPTAQLPSYVDDVIEAYTRSGATALSSTWLSLTDGGAALTPEKGKIYLIMSSGSYQNKQYRWSGSTYVLCNPSDVNSVNGFTGVVVLKELTIQKNGTQVGDKFNGSANKTINIAVPTKTSDITNDSGFITAADDITGNAATATNATNDGSGNNIVNTYVKKAGDTMTGNLTIQKASPTLTIKASDTSEAVLAMGNSQMTKNVLRLSSGDANGANLVVEGGASTIISSGEAGSSMLSFIGAHQTTERIYMVSDDVMFFDTYAQTFTNRVGFQLDNSGELLPTKADVLTNNSGSIGNSTYQWNTIYGKTIYANGTDIDAIYVKKAGDTMTGALAITSGGLKVQTGYIYGDGGTSTNHAVKLGHANDNEMNFYEYGGLYNFYKSVSGTNTLLGKITTNGWEGNVVGNVTGTASKATGDKNGLDITNYIKDLSISGTTLTYTKGDNTTGTITTYTLPVAGTGINGTLGGVKIGSGLSIDGTTGVLSATGGGTADNVEWSGVLNKPTNISYWTNDSGYITKANVMAGATSSTAGEAGVVPKPNSGDQAKFLRGDAQWATVATTDTKNTAGATDISTKIFLIGAPAQTANPQTYSDNEVFATNGVLQAKEFSVNAGANIVFNSVNQCIEFNFA